MLSHRHQYISFWYFRMIYVEFNTNFPWHVTCLPRVQADRRRLNSWWPLSIWRQRTYIYSLNCRMLKPRWSRPQKNEENVAQLRILPADRLQLPRIGSFNDMVTSLEERNITYTERAVNSILLRTLCGFCMEKIVYCSSGICAKLHLKENP